MIKLRLKPNVFFPTSRTTIHFLALEGSGAFLGIALIGPVSREVGRKANRSTRRKGKEKKRKKHSLGLNLRDLTDGVFCGPAMCKMKNYYCLEEDGIHTGCGTCQTVPSTFIYQMFPSCHDRCPHASPGELQSKADRQECCPTQFSTEYMEHP